MKIRYDAKVDAAYISLAEDADGLVFEKTYACDPAQIDGQINLDFDVSGRLMGIEVLQASLVLPRSLLETAQS